ncbi:Cobalt/zinc/cadmium efflux RND transporter, membrane fusion protein, CzcB family [hydrothermal vent metagenome]|uniref:Cobalt/zinc/cadmium efflux RND transporter, membrane fusion protein, CzcB family n=1 Tax=hydrothermal vent metagenome TaxID=652676 RepID=A0A3B1CEZ2_9ZZZZ
MHRKIVTTMFIGILSGVMIFGIGACDLVSGEKQAKEDHDDHDAEKGKDHDDHDDGDEHGEEIVSLSKAELKEFGIEVATAESGELKRTVVLPGEIVVNADRIAHIVPRVSGVIRKVLKSLGDKVRAGEVMAVLDSRELSDAKAEYLAAHERLALAEMNFAREDRLRKKKVSSEEDYLNAKQALAEIRIELRSTRQKLHALGFSKAYLAELLNDHDTTFTQYKITAPFSGTVIEKHVTLGEVVKDDAEIFIVADLNSVWVNLSVYQKDLPFVRNGEKVLVAIGHGTPDIEGTISYIGPIVGEKTRTALARVVLPNKKGNLRPGLFVTGAIEIDGTTAHVIAPKTALQTFEDRDVIFVKTDEGFEPKPVTIGRTNRAYVEIISGLSAGQKYVSKGAFTLKAELSKGAFGSGHSH